MSDALLSVRGVRTFYGSIMALKGVDMDVAKGEITARPGRMAAIMADLSGPKIRIGELIREPLELKAGGGSP